jgi:transposase
MNPEHLIRDKYTKFAKNLNERSIRLWAASEALALGQGGVKVLHQITGLSTSTIYLGIKELEKGLSQENNDRVRQKGGGRKSIEEEFPGLLVQLQQLVELTTIGDPMQPLLWTCKSTKNLSQELKNLGFDISDRTVSHLLHKLGYSLQSNRKILEGKQHPDRNVQFEYINKKIKEFQANNSPVISIDAKKKELVGNFKNAGQEWHLTGEPENVNVHDFESGKRNKKAIPYGVYDVTWNAGWVSVGVDHDTAEFAVESLRKWWVKMGYEYYPAAKQLLIIADSGGSNSSRGRLWKTELQKLANETRLHITVCHLPPGTSKWNKIEHKLFCHITKNWRGRPLTSYEVIVNLISHTTTKKGLKISAELDFKMYPLGKKVSNSEMKSLNIHYHGPNDKWSYTIGANEERSIAKSSL